MRAGSVVLQGEMGSVAAVARNFSRLDGIEEALEWVRRGLGYIQQAGNAQALDAMLIAYRPLEVQAQQIASARLAAGQALQRYADQVAMMQQEVRALQSRQALEQSECDRLVSRLANLDSDTTVSAVRSRQLNARLNEVRAVLRHIERQLTELDQARVRADRVCAEALGACTARLTGVGSGTVSFASVRTVGQPQSEISLLFDLLSEAFAGPGRVLERWNSLSDSERARLIKKFPLVVGNLNGIPFEDRITANAETAKTYLKDSGLSDQEKQYWKKVRDGKVRLVVLDREQERIVEMLGELGPNTTQVITYVPGTTTRLKDFYSGEVKRVPGYLAGEIPGSLVFVYKDFPNIGWLSNLDEDAMTARGEKAARFAQGAVGTDPRLSGVPKQAVGYSAGIAVLGGSELYGAKYDKVVSLGGSYVSDEWTPQPGTEYVDIRYSGDLLNQADRLEGLNTINRMPEVFSQIRLVSPEPGEESWKQHGRLGGGPDKNGPALRELRDLLEQP